MQSIQGFYEPPSFCHTFPLCQTGEPHTSFIVTEMSYFHWQSSATACAPAANDIRGPQLHWHSSSEGPVRPCHQQPGMQSRQLDSAHVRLTRTTSRPTHLSIILVCDPYLRGPGSASRSSIERPTATGDLHWGLSIRLLFSTSPSINPARNFVLGKVIFLVQG